MTGTPGPAAGISVLPVPGIPEVRPGDDLAKLITGAAPWLRDGDVLVVTSKIVSKAEGALVDVPADGLEREAARARVLDEQTARTVATRGHTRIVQTHHGFVMASAGIDASNVERERLVLLPADPDRSARELRIAMRERYGLDVAVIISDTMGRPWRNGLTDVALGCAGIPALRDHRGETDPHGNDLHITQMAIVDELSAAGELVKGKIDQVPVAVVRGLLDRTIEGSAVVPALVRDASQDLFSMGTAEARQAGQIELLRWQFELTWQLLDHHLTGLTDEDCLWEPVGRHCWTVRRDASGDWTADWLVPEPDPVPATSIAWLTWHIGWWWTTATAGVRGDSIPARESIRWPGSAAGTVTWLNELRTGWLDQMDGKLDLAATARFPWQDNPDRTVGHVLGWVNVELMKNAAEIGQLRHLRNARS